MCMNRPIAHACANLVELDFSLNLYMGSRLAQVLSCDKASSNLYLNDDDKLT